jgi:hypothetical protein
MGISTLTNRRSRKALTTLAIRATSAGKLKASFGGFRRNLRHACRRGARRRCGSTAQAHADHAGAARIAATSGCRCSG